MFQNWIKNGDDINENVFDERGNANSFARRRRVLLAVFIGYSNSQNNFDKIRNGFKRNIGTNLASDCTSSHIQNLCKESITDSTIKKAATDFLHKPNFHQNLRNEILFGLTPTTLKACVDQRQTINDVANTMLSGGFLRQHGLKSLATIIAFEAIIKEQVIFACKTENITSFFKSGPLY